MPDMFQYKCLRCGHAWYPRIPEKPKVCPGCNSPYWDEMRKMPVSESCPAAKKEDIVLENVTVMQR